MKKYNVGLVSLLLFFATSAMNAIDNSQESKWLKNNATPEQKETIAKLRLADAIAHDKGYTYSSITQSSSKSAPIAPELIIFFNFPSSIQQYIMSKLPNTVIDVLHRGVNTTNPNPDYKYIDYVKDMKPTANDINNFDSDTYNWLHQ